MNLVAVLHFARRHHFRLAADDDALHNSDMRRKEVFCLLGVVKID